MKNNCFKIILLLICTFLLTANSDAQDNADVQHVKVSMRMIGHQVLLNSWDNVSRVLPIEREGNQYRIRFEAPFQFEPSKLVATVNKIVEDSQIATSYLVEVEQCETKKIVYSYEITPYLETDLIPCGGRVQPKDCYSILITILDKNPLLADARRINATPSQDAAIVGKKASNFWLIGLLLFAVPLLGGVFFFYQKKQPIVAIAPSLEAAPMPNPNIILIGAYQFNPINMMLSFADEAVELTGKEADLLIVLHEAKNTTLEREVILQKVWGDEGDYVGRTLDVFISKLRKKLSADPNLKIVNIRGVGYKFVVERA